MQVAIGDRKEKKIQANGSTEGRTINYQWLFLEYMHINIS